MTPIVVHLKTQRGQPYGSERRCCERCGIMIWDPPAPKWVDNEEAFKKLPVGYMRCDAVKGEVKTFQHDGMHGQCIVYPRNSA